MEFVLKIKARNMCRKNLEYMSLPIYNNEDIEVKSFNESYFSTLNKDLSKKPLLNGKFKCSPILVSSSSLSRNIKHIKNKQYSQFSNVLLNNAIKSDCKENSSINDIALLTCHTQFSTNTLTEKVFFETSNLNRLNDTGNLLKKQTKNKFKLKGFNQMKNSPLKNINDNRREIDQDTENDKSFKLHSIFPQFSIHEDKDLSQFNNKHEIFEKSIEKLEKLKEKVISDKKTKLIINKIKILKPIIYRNAKNKFSNKKRIEHISSEMTNNLNKKSINLTSENERLIDRKPFLNRVMNKPKNIKVRKDRSLVNDSRKEGTFLKYDNDNFCRSDKLYSNENSRKKHLFHESLNKNTISSTTLKNNYRRLNIEKDNPNKKISLADKTETFTQTALSNYDIKKSINESIFYKKLKVTNKRLESYDCDNRENSDIFCIKKRKNKTKCKINEGFKDKNSRL